MAYRLPTDDTERDRDLRALRVYFPQAFANLIERLTHDGLCRQAKGLENWMKFELRSERILLFDDKSRLNIVKCPVCTGRNVVGLFDGGLFTNTCRANCDPVAVFSHYRGQGRTTRDWGFWAEAGVPQIYRTPKWRAAQAMAGHFRRPPEWRDDYPPPDRETLEIFNAMCSGAPIPLSAARAGRCNRGAGVRS